MNLNSIISDFHINQITNLRKVLYFARFEGVFVISECLLFTE